MGEPAPRDPVGRLPSTRREWSALLALLGVRPSKGLGQHFLYERGIVQRLVRHAGIGPADRVLEIGPGLGILTSELLLRAGEVTAIELDRRLAAHLRETFGDEPRFRLVEGNALQTTTADLFADGDPFAVAANLPYAVGAAVVRHLLEQPHRPTRLAVMLQMEVAQRLTAEPGAMSVLGVAAQFYAEARIAFTVPPTVFIPPPAVESAVAILDVRPQLPLPETEHAAFFRVVNAGFRQKRKQVANSLAAELVLPKETVTAWLSGVGVDPMRRAQTLSVDEWVSLTRALPFAARPV
ncbi:MAG: SSU rRNA (adenine(1518)-N(6)/adenine(1519)-N(6))-dimethyltransferase [uncultured Thermomicrobiales bacterium]|uniref:Ribosomal RNA small subunit methyltransferase A n=1 Tax=uncultured Thermomicrobiales bacterium TaxID=1645740 RepID=A0A6J4VBU6_9BACT|nr:MAG: SSU rRNA (adenine(1518)-N(6)/adenine(1519)-N(6))-dimethyltransferase [uncultured Thermomicrobiales bacterium]